MTTAPHILLQPGDDWSFGPLADKLASFIGCGISEDEDGFCYVLSAPKRADVHSYNPLPGLEVAADKRKQAEIFAKNGIPTPETHLLADENAVRDFLRSRADERWLLKFPTACGAFGHHLVSADFTAKRGWPQPFLLQRFIAMDIPRVYRVYCISGMAVGSTVRRFSAGKGGIFVAHALGARYHHDDPVDEYGLAIAENAVVVAGFRWGFCVVDLLRDDAGNWLVLELGSDGIHNLVDRDYDNPELDLLVHTCIAMDFRLHALALGEPEFKPVPAQLNRETELPYQQKVHLIDGAMTRVRAAASERPSP
jgi:hypothetical protein